MNSCFAGFLKYVVSPFMEGPDVELPNFNAVEPPLSWPWVRVDVLLGKVPLPCRRALLLDGGFEQDGLAVFGSLLELPRVFDGEAQPFSQGSPLFLALLVLLFDASFCRCTGWAFRLHVGSESRCFGVELS